MSAQADLASLHIDRSRPRRRAIWPYILVVLGILALFKAPSALRAMQGVEVVLAPIVKGSTLAPAAAKGAGELSATGYVVADRKSTVASKYTGRLEKLLVRESQIVKKGQLLAELDARDVKALIEQAKAQEAQARAESARLKAAAAQAEAEIGVAAAPLATSDAELKELEVTLADAERRLERDTALAKEGALGSNEAADRKTEVQMAKAKIATIRERRREAEQRVLAAKATAETARMSALVSEQAILAASANIGVLQVQLSESKITSPFDGVIIEKTAEEGEMVAPISVGGTMAKGSIVTVAAWDSLQAEVDVSEAYIGRVKPDGRAQITVDALPGKFFPGKVKRILPHAERSKATVQVRVEFLAREADPEFGVLPDMSIRVKFLPDSAPKDAELGVIPEKLLVNKKAVQGTGAGTFVWVFADDKVTKKTVEVAPLPPLPGQPENPKPADTPVEGPEYLLVKAGLAAGDKVVIEGAEHLLEDGQKARSKEK